MLNLKINMIQDMKTRLSLAFVAICVSAGAQTLQDAITKTHNENFAAAAADFSALIAKEASKGENYFYFGENYFSNDDIDGANAQYQKGADLNATYPLNYVGLGKVLLFKGKEADAKAMFYKAATLGANKNAEVMRKTAEAYLLAENKNPDEAINQLNNAIKLDAKNPENYILLGDALLEKNPTDGSAPIKNYQKASELNPKSTKGILREGKLYQRGRNYQLAIDYYKKALSIDTTFAPAFRELAEVYMMAGRNKDAIGYWKKYLDLNNSNDARYRYFTALYNNKQYTDAVGEGENLIKKGYNNLYIPRLLGYAYTEMGNKLDTSAFTKGYKNISKFFEVAGPSFKFIYTDYKYKGLLLSKLGKDSLAIIEMEKAVSIEPSKANELYTAMASIYMKSKKYDKAIVTFEKKMNGDPKNLSGQDNFDLGRAYYFGPKDFVKSDSCFSAVCRASTNYSLAYFWRGRVNSQLDPKNERWQAKPYHEKFISMVKPEERTSGSYKNNVIEACEYLGYYYVTTKDNAKATEYFTIIKDLDPNNSKQKAFFAPPKGK